MRKINLQVLSLVHSSISVIPLIRGTTWSFNLMVNLSRSTGCMILAVPRTIFSLSAGLSARDSSALLRVLKDNAQNSGNSRWTGLHRIPLLQP